MRRDEAKSQIEKPRALLGGEPHILALADRAGGPQLFQRGDEGGDLGVGVHRRWGKAHALGAALHGGVIDRLHVDPVVGEERVA